MRTAALVLVVVLGLGLATFFVFAPAVLDRRFNRVAQGPPPAVSDAARELHARLFVADLHADFLLWRRDLLRRYERGHVDLPRLVEGGVGLQTFAVVTKVPWGANYDRTEGDSDQITALAVVQRWPPAAWGSLRERALYQAQRLHRAAERSGGRLIVVRTVEDLERHLERRAAGGGRVAGLLAMEGLHALEGDVANVDVFFDAGYRMLAPVHMFDNDVAGSSGGVAKGGLTELGRAVLRRMETLGLLVDLAHASARTIDDVLAAATRPVVVSHSGVQGTCPGARNLSDDQLRRIAATGGVVGVGFWPEAVCGSDVAAIVRAIRHAVAVAGIDHVAFGSDFDGTVRTPFDAAGMAALTEGLLAGGFTEAEIAQIAGGNVLRVLRQALPRASR